MDVAGEPFRLEIEVHWNAVPIRGRVHQVGGGLDRHFAGWLGLIAALEEAREMDQALRTMETRTCR
jgi:hypothetical protein